MDKNRVLIIVAALLVFAGFIVNTASNRYTRQNELLILDKWTGNVYTVHQMRK